MNVMQDQHYEMGSDLFLEGVASMKCMLIVKGSADIYSSNDPHGMSASELDTYHNIIRPSSNARSITRQADSEDNSCTSIVQSGDAVVKPATVLETIHSSSEKGEKDESQDLKEAGTIVIPGLELGKSSSAPELKPETPPVASPTEQPTSPQVNPMRSKSTGVADTPIGSSRKIISGISSYKVSQVSEGCLLGFGSLRGKAALEDGWVWKPGRGGVSTFLATVISEEFECLEFTIDVYERLFTELEMSVQQRRGTVKVASSSHLNRDLRSFDMTKFVVKHCLGCGSFGSVIYWIRDS